MASIARRDRGREGLHAEAAVDTTPPQVGPALRTMADFRRHVRNPWLGYAFIAWAIGLGAWSGWLAVTLPTRHLAPNWNIAWGGFDVIMAISLIATGIAAWRGSAWFPMCAVATATLLVVDAWFDILTATPGEQLANAITAALLIELPLATLCLVMAWRRVRRARLLLVAHDPGERTETAA